MKCCKTQVERLMGIHEWLQKNGYPNNALIAERFEVSRKTAQRDIEFLRDRMNAPIEYSARHRGYFYENPNFMLPSISMSEGELTALLIGSRILKEYQGSPVAKKLTGVFNKLSEQLPDSITIKPEELFGRFTFHSPPAMPVKPKIWETVVRGLLQQRYLSIKYGAYDKKPFRIKPLHLMNLQGDWYLIVQYEKYDNFRQIALSRIKQATLLQRHFECPDNFDPGDFLSATFSRFAGEDKPFRVKLVFDKETAYEIEEREWHPNQDLRFLKDGRLELTFEAKGMIEVMRWILAWGSHCTVKTPSALKKMVAREIQAMGNRLA